MSRRPDTKWRQQPFGRRGRGLKTRVFPCPRDFGKKEKCNQEWVSKNGKKSFLLCCDFDLEKLISSGHYHCYCVYQIWEAMQWVWESHKHYYAPPPSRPRARHPDTSACQILCHSFQVICQQMHRNLKRLWVNEWTNGRTEGQTGGRVVGVGGIPMCLRSLKINQFRASSLPMCVANLRTISSAV